MPYLNLDLDYFNHPKTSRLIGLLGKGSEVLPIKLWAYAGKYHAKDGRLAGYSAQEIEAIVGWWGRPGELTEALARVGFVRKDTEGFSINDWSAHSGHIFSISERNRKVANARWQKLRKVSKIKAKTGVYQTSTTGMPQHILAYAVTPNGVAPRKSAPIQVIVDTYARIRPGTPKDGTPAFRQFYGRNAKAAKELLVACGGALDKAMTVLSASQKHWENVGLTWTLETVVKDAMDPSRIMPGTAKSKQQASCPKCRLNHPEARPCPQL